MMMKIDIEVTTPTAADFHAIAMPAELYLRMNPRVQNEASVPLME
jgi:hypothetical protein